jgi:hypothetical protein
MIPDVQRVLEPGYLAGLAQADVDELRAKRAECSDLENGLSYTRRLAQGRLDVLRAETERRAEGAGGDLADLVARLPELLTSGQAGGGSGRLDPELDPPEDIASPLVAALDGVVDASVVSDVAELDDVALSAAVIALRDFEEAISANRRAIHVAIDSLNDELARRIGAGEAPVQPS